MTFFANSGIAWPKLEQQTREAGADSLEGGSQLWMLFARLERGAPEPGNRDAIAQAAEQLDRASNVYRSIAAQLDGQIVDGLSPSELELAAVRVRPTSYDEEWALDRLERMRHIPIAESYRELSRRLRTLASNLRAFAPNREDTDLAPSVFGMMRQWEMIASLARIIAVVSRRSNISRSGPRFDPESNPNIGPRFDNESNPGLATT